MSAKEYRPDRAITSGKLRKLIGRTIKVDGKDYKRVFKKKLIISRGWVRGYTSTYKYNDSYRDVIVVLNQDDTEVLDIYMVDDCKREATSLGLDEILTSE